MGDSGVVLVLIPVKSFVPIPAFLCNLIPIPIPKWLKISLILESIPILELESPIFDIYQKSRYDMYETFKEYRQLSKCIVLHE